MKFFSPLFLLLCAYYVSASNEHNMLRGVAENSDQRDLEDSARGPPSIGTLLSCDITTPLDPKIVYTVPRSGLSCPQTTIIVSEPNTVIEVLADSTIFSGLRFLVSLSGSLTFRAVGKGSRTLTFQDNDIRPIGDNGGALNSIAIGGSITFEPNINLKFVNNKANQGGGIAIANSGRIFINGNVVFDSNQAGGGGGGLVVFGGSTVNIKGDVIFKNNIGGDGGGFKNIEGEVNINGNVKFEKNTANGVGGGYVDIRGIVNLNGEVEFKGNRAIASDFAVGGAFREEAGKTTFYEDVKFERGNLAEDGGNVFSVTANFDSDGNDLAFVEFKKEVTFKDAPTFSSTTLILTDIYNRGTIKCGDSAYFRNDPGFVKGENHC